MLKAVESKIPFISNDFPHKQLHFLRLIGGKGL
jgi:hypothetical protein